MIFFCFFFRMHMNFSNIFKDKQLSDNINNIFNENHQLMFTEIRQSLGKVRGKFMLKYMEPLFSAFPYRTLFAN